MAKFTQRFIDSIKPGEPRFIWDDGLARFGLRVSPRAVSYIVDFFVGTKRRRVNLGPTAFVTFNEARDRAGEIILASKRGRDITVEESRRGVPTFASVWHEMIELDTLKLSPVTIEDYQDRAERHILPKLGGKLIADISHTDVRRVIGAVTGERGKAYAVVLIRKAMNFARDQMRVLPETHRNPTHGIATKKVKSRARALEPEDVARFGAALGEMEGEGSVSPWLANLPASVAHLRPSSWRGSHAHVGSRQPAPAHVDRDRQDRRSRNPSDAFCGVGDRGHATSSRGASSSSRAGVMGNRLSPPTRC